MKHMLLTFDVEEFDLIKDQYNFSYKGLKEILKLINKYCIRCTFFVTANFAQKYPKLIKAISKNHEIGLHGLSHKDNYSALSQKKSYKKLKKAKEKIEKIISKKIIGFRAPRFSCISKIVLKNLKLKYDSSLLPTYIPLSPTYTLGRFKNLFKKRCVFFEDNIIEVPLSVIPLLRLPFIWIVFRNMPLFYSKLCTKLSLINNNFINLVFHSWDFADLDKLNLPFLIKRNTGKKLIKDLDNYLNWCIKKKYKFSTIKDFIKNDL